MDLNIAGKVAFITGGSRGLGRASALALAKEGVHIVVCARGEQSLRRITDEVQALGVSCYAFAADLTERRAANEAWTQAEAKLGRVDILVNNVGGSLGGKDLTTTEVEHYEQIVGLNFWSAVAMMRNAIPSMVKRKWGRIINIASIYGREYGGGAPYMSAKAAMIAASKHTAIAVAKEGVTVNSIAPGSILHEGGSWEKFVRGNSDDAVAQFIASNLPMGKFGSPEPIGAMCAFLASEQAWLVTGACINVDGGQSHSLI